MKIAVCIKQVPDSWAEKKMVGGLLDRANVDAVLNDLDEYAVEEALRIAEAHGGNEEGGANKVIQNYVTENEIETATEVVIKTSGTRSKVKISIIQQIDRKTSLEEIAQNLKLSLLDLLQEIEQITYSGTKLNIDYYIHRIMDDEREDILLDYFMNAETDHIKAALDELEGEDFTEEELRVYRIKFISEHAN
jgi:hypothetical protein